MQAMASKVPEFVAPFDTEIVRKVTKVMKSSLGHGPSPPPGPPSYSRTSRRRWRPADADPDPHGQGEWMRLDVYSVQVKELRSYH